MSNFNLKNLLFALVFVVPTFSFAQNKVDHNMLLSVGKELNKIMKITPTTNTESSIAEFFHPIQRKYSELLGVIPGTITNLNLYDFIEKWYGVRYRFGGTSRSGIDCSAFVQKLYESVFCMNMVRTACAQFSASKMVAKMEDLKEGDLIFFHIHTKRISHVGVYLKNHFFVHASSSRGVMISNLNDSYWRKYFACAGRFM